MCVCVCVQVETAGGVASMQPYPQRTAVGKENNGRTLLYDSTSSVFEPFSLKGQHCESANCQQDASCVAGDSGENDEGLNDHNLASTGKAALLLVVGNSLCSGKVAINPSSFVLFGNCSWFAHPDFALTFSATTLHSSFAFIY